MDPGLSYVDVLKTATEVKIVLHEPLSNHKTNDCDCPLPLPTRSEIEMVICLASSCFWFVCTEADRAGASWRGSSQAAEGGAGGRVGTGSRGRLHRVLKEGFVHHGLASIISAIHHPLTLR